MWVFARMAPSMLRKGAGISKLSAAVLAYMRFRAAVDSQVNDQGLFLCELLRASRVPSPDQKPCWVIRESLDTHRMKDTNT